MHRGTGASCSTTMEVGHWPIMAAPGDTLNRDCLRLGPTLGPSVGQRAQRWHGERLVNERNKFLKNPPIWACWFSLVNSVLGDKGGGLRQEDPHKFKTNLGYTGSFSPA